MTSAKVTWDWLFAAEKLLSGEMTKLFSLLEFLSVPRTRNHCDFAASSPLSQAQAPHVIISPCKLVLLLALSLDLGQVRGHSQP